MLLTVDLVDALYSGLVVKIFPNKATTDKNAKEGEKDDEKFIIVEQAGRLFLGLDLRNGFR